MIMIMIIIVIIIIIIIMITSQCGIFLETMLSSSFVLFPPKTSKKVSILADVVL